VWTVTVENLEQMQNGKFMMDIISALMQQPSDMPQLELNGGIFQSARNSSLSASDGCGVTISVEFSSHQFNSRSGLN